jgi:hypothetical protein
MSLLVPHRLLRKEDSKEVLIVTRTDDCTESPTVPIPRRDRMTRMMQQHTCTLILGLTALGFTLAGSHAGAVSPSDSSSATHFSDQHWDRKLPSASRFTILSAFGDAAVRDNETGLVWEKTLETAEMSWTEARAACADRDVGGRKGWRLPSISELASLVDPSIRSGPALPLDHPFTNVLTDVYWSATSVTDNPKNAWLVFFDTAKATFAVKTITFHFWCVRGGMTADQY